MIPQVQEVIRASAEAVRKLGEALEASVDALQDEINRRPDGVYVVALDEDVTGPNNIVWTFTHEEHADAVAKLLREHVGQVQVTYEPTSKALDDDHLVQYLIDRVGAEHFRLPNETDNQLIERLIEQTQDGA